MAANEPMKPPQPQPGALAETAEMRASIPLPHSSRRDPDSIGAYRILERIGEGGMGIVYKAEQREPVRRIVALKVIKVGMDTREVVARFEAERQALAMMAHPNVAKVLDGGMTEGGRPYFAMEFVPGVPLTDYCNQNKLTTRQRLELFIPVCNAVQHAHHKGIIHRDLKPSNVLVQMFDGKPVPKVIDFGIAKATNQSLTASTLFTQTGSMIGTPEYMSPEQAMTSGLDVDTRTDIYSLGVMLYELLTGTLPFDARTLREAGMAGMAKIIRDSEPQKPSTRLTTLEGEVMTSTAHQHRSDPRALQREIAGDLDWITLKAMEKDRTCRYETANGFALDVQRHLADEPVLARPPTTAYRIRKFVRKHKTGVAAGCAIAAALVLAIAGTSAGWIRTRAALHRAETAEAKATEEQTRVKLAQSVAEKEARRARASNQFMRNMLSSAQPDGKQAGNQVKVVDVLDTTGRALNRLKDQPELELDGRLTLASTFAALNLHSRAVENYNRALTLSRALGGDESEQTLDITADLLFSMSNAGKVVAAEPMARQCVDSARRVFGEHHSVTRNALNSFGLVLFQNEQTDAAEKVFRALIEESERYGTEGDPKGRGRYYNNLALVVASEGRRVEADQLQRQAIELFKREGEFGLRRTAGALHNLAINLYSRDKLAEARQAMTEAIEECRKSLGDVHPITIKCTSDLEQILEREQDFAGALLKRLEMRTQIKQAGVSTQSRPELDLVEGELMLRAGRADSEAQEAFNKGLEAARKNAASGEPSAWDAARDSWTQAGLFTGLRIDRAWGGSAIRQQAAYTAWLGLFNHAPDAPGPDYIDWEKLRFKIEPWPAGKPPVEGGRQELWTMPDPEPGVYLFSISIPRRTGGPIRAAEWMLVCPWKIDLYRADSSILNTEESWKKLFASEPAAHGTESMLAYNRYGLANFGFGPSHRLSEFALAATARFKLPEGRYHLRLFADGSRRAFVDGSKLLDAWSSQVDSVEVTDTASSPPSELRVEWALGTARLMVLVQPISPLADRMIATAKGPLSELELSVDVLSRQIARGKAEAGTYYERGSALARRGQFREAAEDFRKATELDPSEHFRWYLRACTLAYLHDEAQFRETCRAMLDRFRNANTPEACERIGKASLLLPGASADLPAAMKLIDRAIESPSAAQFVHWFQIAKALAEYRRGPERFDAATALLAAARSKHDPKGPAAATCDLIGAMIHVRQGDLQEGKQRMARAEAAVAAMGNTPGVDDFGNGGLENRLIYEVLHREAEELIKAGATPRPNP